MSTPRYNTYVGMRYVPLFDGEWDITKTYEPLTIVSYQGNSYTSRTFIPTGTNINNTEYWALTGNYNAQVEYYRQETAEVSEGLENITDCFVTPEMFGAYGDDYHDDSTYIQEALDTGKAVAFNKNKTYLCYSAINVAKGAIIYGCNSTLHFNSEVGVNIVDSGDTQDHNMTPITIKDLNIKGNNLNTLIKIQNILRSNFLNINLSNFNIGIEYVSGYENYFNNIRLIGNSTSTGIKVSTGDSYFDNIIIRDSHIGIHIVSGSNKWTNVHGWIYNPALYNGSIMILDEAAGGAHNEWFNPYFDTYCICYKKTALSTLSLYSPMLYNNFNISNQVENPDQAYFLHVTYPEGQAAYANRIYVYQLITQLGGSTQIYDMCNDTSLNIKLSHIVASAATETKISELNISDPDSKVNDNASAINTINSRLAISLITNDFITPGTNITVANSSKIYRQGNHIWGTLIVNYSTGFVSGGSETIGTLRHTSGDSHNGVAFFSTSEWDSTSVGYSYLSGTTLTAKAGTSGQTYAKIPIDYIAN